MLGAQPARAALPEGRASTPTATARPGLQELAGNATLLYYMTEEGKEGKNAFVEKRKPELQQVQAAAVSAAT